MNKLFSLMKKRAFAVGTVALLTAGVAVNAQANDVVALKNALYGAGYNIDNVNDRMDSTTRSALKAFQADHAGLKVSGELDDASKQALGMISGDAASAQAVASQQPTASAEAVAKSKKATVPARKEAKKEEDDGWSLW